MMNYLYVFVTALLLSACADPNSECCETPREVTLGEPFSIIKGQHLEVENSIIDITFLEVISDSMCPSDVECVTQGTLEIALEVINTNITLSIGDQQNPTFQLNDYTIELQKLIYPTTEADKANKNSTYAVQMLVTKP